MSVPISPSKTPSTATLRLPIGGMTCQGCVHSVQRGLLAVPGVARADVDLADGAATVDFDSQRVTREQLAEAVRGAGYQPLNGSSETASPGSSVIVERPGEPLVALGGPAAPVEAPSPERAAPSEPVPGATDEHAVADLAITGMTCAGCVHTIEKQLLAEHGVESTEVNLATGTAKVGYDPSRVTVERLTQAVGEAGYAARRALEEETPAGEQEEAEAREWTQRFIVSAIFTAPLLVLAMSHGAISFAGMNWVQLALTLPVLFYGGSRFYRAAWAAARHFTSDMNTLIAVGTGSAFLYSTAATAAPSWVAAPGAQHAPVYFETAAAIITLILLGRVLEGASPWAHFIGYPQVARPAGQDGAGGAGRGRD